MGALNTNPLLWEWHLRWDTGVLPSSGGRCCSCRALWVLAEAPAGTEQLLSLAELLSWGQLPGHLLVLPPEDKEWAVAWAGHMGGSGCFRGTGGEQGLTCHPAPEQFTHQLTVLVTLSALCCLSWVDNGEGEMLSCGLGFM